MIDVPEVLGQLAVERPLFHSEADFQHSLAWELHRRLPDAAIRPERPVSSAGCQLYVDEWMSSPDHTVALELKYKTRGITVDIGGEEYNLKNQSAQDVARYDFIKDVHRLEDLITGKQITIGYAIMLT